MLWIAKTTFSESVLETAHSLGETFVIIVAIAVLHNFALMHREQDFDEDIEDDHEDVPFHIVAVADASGDAIRQPIVSRLFA